MLRASYMNKIIMFETTGSCGSAMRKRCLVPIFGWRHRWIVVGYDRGARNPQTFICEIGHDTSVFLFQKHLEGVQVQQVINFFSHRVIIAVGHKFLVGLLFQTDLWNGVITICYITYLPTLKSETPMAGFKRVAPQTTSPSFHLLEIMRHNGITVWKTPWPCDSFPCRELKVAI